MASHRILGNLIPVKKYVKNQILMPETEPQTSPLTELLNSEELITRQSYSPSKWQIALNKRLAEDLTLRRVPPDQSLYSLYPDDSNASPVLAFRPVTTLRQLGIRSIPDMQRQTLESIDDLEKFSGQKKGLMTFRIARALWHEAQQRKTPKP